MGFSSRFVGTARRATPSPLAAAAVALVFAFGSEAVAQKGGKSGGGGDKDLPVCITMNPDGDLTADEGGSFCNSEQGVTAFVGRRRSITLSLDDKPNQTRRLVVTLSPRLPEAPGDPDPDTDGGDIPGSLSAQPLPDLPLEGVAGAFMVANRVNVLRMGEEGEEPNPNYRNARFRFTDAHGLEWRLLWGPHEQPGGLQATNPDAPAVQITRAEDASGTLQNEWHVVTLDDLAPERLGAFTAFLWLDNPPHGARDYCGAFDVFFEYVAVDEAAGEP